MPLSTASERCKVNEWGLLILDRFRESVESCGKFADIQKFGKNSFFSWSFFPLTNSDGFHVHLFCQKSILLLRGPCFKSWQTEFSAKPFTEFAVREGLALECIGIPLTYRMHILGAQVQCFFACLFKIFHTHFSYMKWKPSAHYSDFLNEIHQLLDNVREILAEVFSRTRSPKLSLISCTMKIFFTRNLLRKTWVLWKRIKKAESFVLLSFLSFFSGYCS